MGTLEEQEPAQIKSASRNCVPLEMNTTGYSIINWGMSWLPMNHGAPGIKVTCDLHEEIKNYCAGAQHAPMAMNMEKLCRQRRQTENLRWKNFVDRGDKRVRRSRAQGGLDQRQARASTENKVPVRKSLVMTVLYTILVPGNSARRRGKA